LRHDPSRIAGDGGGPLPLKPGPNLAEDGAELFPGAARPLLADLEALLAPLPDDRPGLRLQAIPALRGLLGADSAIGQVAAGLIGPESRPVRAILFDKTPATNWSLGWHQDRTIVVRERIDVPGFGPWTVKQGLQHVAPPFDLLARMVTLRVHLDPVDDDNAPLLVAPGSHRLGLVPEEEIAGAIERHELLACHAAVGDVWAYATPILHASQASRSAARRRVLQVDYSADSLPGGLDWLGL
jgi:hypothetical protein